jgi:RNA polymerase sigma-70 factor (ECF subfamily)
MAAWTPRQATRSTTSGDVVSFVGDDETLLDGVQRGQPSAMIALFDRYAPLIERILARILGTDPELPDLVHDVFAGILAGAAKVRKATALKDWLTSVAVFRARTHIRQRMRRRLWERLFVPEQLPEVPVPPRDDAAAEALRVTYDLLGRLPVDERIAFALRTLAGLKLTEVASACGISLATTKRRLARAEQRFLAMAHEQPAIRAWLSGPVGGCEHV